MKGHIVPMQFSYEVVEDYANKLADLAAMSSNPEGRVFYWDLYIYYLNCCGWTEEDFDAEVLKRISDTWEVKFN